MSHTVLQTPHLIIKGRKYSYPIYENLEKDPIDRRDALELNIVIQVNGKLCDFSHSFGLQEDETKCVSIDNWNEWYVIVGLLHSLGYMEEGNHNGLICELIDKTMEE